MPSLTAPVRAVLNQSRLNVILEEHPAAREEFVREIGIHQAEFFARVSHDLRNPLQTIMGFAELLSMEISGSLNAEQQRYVAFIQRDARLLLTIVDQIADPTAD